MKSILPIAAILGSSLTLSCSGGGDANGLKVALPAIQHVFIIVLENRNFDEVFGANSQAPYLSQALVAQGALLTQYYAIGHRSTANYIAMISGQAPNDHTQNDCGTYSDFTAGATVDGNGQAVGSGCVYPAAVHTIADELLAAGLTWKGYMEDMGKDPARESSTCGHPPLNGADNTQQAEAIDQYAAHHNPFIYFHSLLDSGACAQRDVPLSGLSADLGSASTTPNLVFITPNLCDDGHDQPCANGAQGGLAQVDAFLQGIVPTITGSAAFQQDGVLLILFDETDYDGAGSDASACCGEPSGPNTAHPGITGPGGGRTGAVLISPFIKPGTVSNSPYNHYSMLRTLEDVFGVPALGFSAGAHDFGGEIFGR